MSKNEIETGVTVANENDFELRSRSKLEGTEADQHDMRILGKTQQLNVSNHKLRLPQVNPIDTV
jgi:hypothetical protein